MEEEISSFDGSRNGGSDCGSGSWMFRGSSRATSLVMIVALLSGVALWVPGLTMFSGICFVVAFVCALIVVIHSVSCRNHE